MAAAEETASSFVGMLFRFGIRGAAMFAEPTVAEIDEVVGLVH
ncbi:MAG TPA: hypothetical protein VGN90_08400 [Pyrinomonadaceae bacterium]|nr:hypothetical protein [Pyrinomonadaceae bacterium]